MRALVVASAAATLLGLAFAAPPARALIGTSPVPDTQTDELRAPAGFKLDPETQRAMRAFEARCASCHSLGAGAKVGPDLAGVTLRRNDDWLTRWLESPARMSETDEHAKTLLAQYKVQMPDLHLDESEVRSFIRYLHWFDARPAAEGTP